MTTTRFLSALFAISLVGCAMDSDDGLEPDIEELNGDDQGDLPLTLESDTQNTVCGQYCEAYFEGCSDFVFSSRQECTDSCMEWPLGDAPTSGRDDAYCHARHAIRASERVRRANGGFGPSDPVLAAACASASPFGLTCGAADAARCSSYCDGYDIACGSAGFSGPNHCYDWCGDKDPAGNTGSQDTIECRQDFMRAAGDDPGTYCADAGPSSAACSDE